MLFGNLHLVTPILTAACSGIQVKAVAGLYCRFDPGEEFLDPWVTPCRVDWQASGVRHAERPPPGTVRPGRNVESERLNGQRDSSTTNRYGSHPTERMAVGENS